MDDLFSSTCVYIARKRKDEQRCFRPCEPWQRRVAGCLKEESGSPLAADINETLQKKKMKDDLQMSESAWATVLDIWLKQSSTSTCLRMWSDPSVYSTGNPMRTCWAFFLFLQQYKRGSGLREFPVHLIQLQPDTQPNAPPRVLNFTPAREKLVKYWHVHQWSNSGLVFELLAYLLAELQPRPLYDWVSNEWADATKLKSRKTVNVTQLLHQVVPKYISSDFFLCKFN